MVPSAQPRWFGRFLCDKQITFLYIYTWLLNYNQQFLGNYFQSICFSNASLSKFTLLWQCFSISWLRKSYYKTMMNNTLMYICMIGYKNDEYHITLATSTIIILFPKKLEFSKSNQSPKNCERKYWIFKNISFDELKISSLIIYPVKTAKVLW